MIQGRLIKLAAVACLTLVTSLSQAAGPQGRAIRTHLKVAPRAPLAEPLLRSSAALVLDTSNASVLYSRHADVAVPIASITKLMTALVVTDAGQPLDEELAIGTEDRLFGKGTSSRLVPGTRLTRADLMHLALMASENRAAHALGRNYPGGLEECVRAMNAKARELGMLSSHFVEPTGLSDENVASPEDLSKLVLAAAKVPQIREFSTDGDYAVRVGRHMMQFRNTDSLVNKPDWNIVVQKTGYISEAGRCLVMQTVIDNRSLVIVLMNSFGKRTRVADARRVRQWVEATLQHPPALASST
jgi:D-alanyl-D-alanine endopeptidase (penicillin-binding protein 7)